MPGAGRSDWAARQLLYNVSVRHFRDASGDGLGDLQGLSRSLDHLRALGVGTVLLDAVAPAGTADGSRALADWQGVDSTIGDEGRFAELLEAVHALDMRLMMQLTLNQVDPAHPWVEALHADPSDPAARARFRVAAQPTDCVDVPTLPLDPYGELRWAALPGTSDVVYHRFAAVTPDLDLNHPEVVAAAEAAVSGWLATGLDGLWFWAPYAWFEDGERCEDLESGRARLAALRALLPTTAQVFAAWGRHALQAPQADSNRVAEWLGTGGRPVADLVPAHDLTAWLERSLVDATARIALADAMADHWQAARDRPGAWVFATGHAEARRLGAVLNEDRSRRLALATVLLSPFVPMLHYGDELGIGTRDGPIGSDWRNASLPSMPWHGEGPGFGFGPVAPLFPVPRDAPERNVTAQWLDAGSPLRWTERMLRLRYAEPALTEGGFQPLIARDTSGRADTDVLAWLRPARDQGQTALVVLNFADEARTVELLPEQTGWAAGAVLENRLAQTPGELAVWPGDPGTLRLDLSRRVALVIMPPSEPD